MADQTCTTPSSSSSQYPHTRPISSFLFGSLNISNGFLGKDRPEIGTRSPNSVLDRKPFSTLGNQTPAPGYDKNQSDVGLPGIFSGNKHSWEDLDPKGIGIALVDSLNDEKADKNLSQPNSRRMILFGSKLKIRIPSFSAPSSFSPTDSQKSPADFGIKTRNSQVMGSLSPFGCRRINASAQTKESPRIFSADFLSASEMENSEDYTCVISHGPNPKTTHIYDNCVVESCCGVVGLSELKKEHCSSSETSSFPPESFQISFCNTCKKDLELDKDNFTYRDDKSLCSSECRCQEMLY
ncbi:hypothetical protein U1Q18_020214 [Sarracenia purpurea var. burkii]